MQGNGTSKGTSPSLRTARRLGLRRPRVSISAWEDGVVEMHPTTKPSSPGHSSGHEGRYLSTWEASAGAAEE